MSKDKKQQALVPRLRFPEFRDAPAWRQKKLASVFGKITNGQANAQDHVEGGEYPLFDRSEIIKRSNNFMFDAEAVIIPGEGMRFQPRYFKGKFNLHQRAYALLECKEDSTFTFYALDRSNGLLARKAVQSTVLSLRLPILENFTIGCPSLAEQRKIADCLGSLDDLIAAEGRKLAALREHKKGLMQQLFPREGETRPWLRFPEFRNAGEWKKKKLGCFCRIQTGKKDANEGGQSGAYPFFTCAERHIFSDSYSFDTEAILVAGNANVGKCTYYNGRFEAYQRTYVLTDFAEIDVSYLFAFLDARLQHDMMKQIQSANVHIKLSHVLIKSEPPVLT
jgi:type I restriction enzyme S subunit